MIKRLEHFSIRHRHTGTIIFEGLYPSFKACVEDAVSKNIALSHADLRDAHLSHANLDGGNFPYADFSGSLCQGINLSECDLTHTKFNDADLMQACLCESQLSHTAFQNTRLKDINISNSELYRVRFLDFSALDIDFATANRLDKCQYIDALGNIAIFSAPPIVLKGFSKRFVFIDNQVDIHGRLYDLRHNQEALQGLYQDLKTIAHTAKRVITAREDWYKKYPDAMA